MQGIYGLILNIWCNSTFYGFQTSLKKFTVEDERIVLKHVRGTKV